MSRMGNGLARMVCVLATAWMVAAHAQAPSPADGQAEIDRAWQAASDSAQPGPASIKLRDQALLKLPADYVWIPEPAASQLMRAMGNHPDSRQLGLIFPTGQAGWLVVAEYEPSGYIKDDDARDWKVDEMFQSLKGFGVCGAGGCDTPGPVALVGVKDGVSHAGSGQRRTAPQQVQRVALGQELVRAAIVDLIDLFQYSHRIDTDQHHEREQPAEAHSQQPSNAPQICATVFRLRHSSE